MLTHVKIGKLLSNDVNTYIFYAFLISLTHPNTQQQQQQQQKEKTLGTNKVSSHVLKKSDKKFSLGIFSGMVVTKRISCLLRTCG